MQCPICHAPMELYREESVSSKKKGTYYKRARYVCRKDDVWGRLELPQKNMETKEEAPTMQIV